MQASCGFEHAHGQGSSVKKSSELLKSLPQLLFDLMGNVNIVAIEKIYEEYKGKFKFSDRGFDSFVSLSKIPENVQEEQYIGYTPNKKFAKDRVYSSDSNLIVYHRFSISNKKGVSGYLILGVRFNFNSECKNEGIVLYPYVKYKDIEANFNEKKIAITKNKEDKDGNVEFFDKDNLGTYLKSGMEDVFRKAGINL